MLFMFDPAKDAANIEKHGISLADYTPVGGDIRLISLRRAHEKEMLRHE